ncbi:homeobox-leucine zipper protein HOX11-like isoform X2 [Papaver somniferum]|uniref:homeobox-leucine zipper protein HOX11-like isoform X2 n=1 Tax=Papaver somniferum TaxID=3469 RepID=UPI000E6FF6DA|nr:homeobox-leucine zipper protein HOX11-like isoform X2 [Papaver somniferum]
MELGLSLGDTSRPFGCSTDKNRSKMMKNNKGLGFCMALGVGYNGRDEEEEEEEGDDEKSSDEQRTDNDNNDSGRNVSSADPVQLNLLPLVPFTRNQTGFPWSSENDAGSRGFDVNRIPASAEELDDGAAISSPNSTISSFQIDFSMYRNGGNSKRDSEIAGLNDGDNERTSSRASDEEENGLARKKLRLSKEQSAFLEESFKEHNTLNPKQKVALAKQLNLRPRQVEVWFQNRRARTKLKQTEVDCEYLKRCCETLTEENRRLQKDIQELRALKTSNPYYMQLPATTLTMCPSCERVATTTTNSGSTAAATAPPTTTTTAPTTATTNIQNSNPFSHKKPRFYPFSQPHHASAAS